MGYSLYVTRKPHWFDEQGPVIALQEWIALVDADPELRWEPALGEHFAVLVDGSSNEPPWLAWDNGNLESKHPSKAMIGRMHAIAASLGARLVGEEGETYDEDGEQAAPLERVSTRPGWLAKIRALFVRPAADDPGLRVGVRVKDAWGQTGTVTHVDLRSQGGMGEISVDYDDGRTATFAAIAHGLDSLDD